MLKKPITLDGFNRLCAELEDLINNHRPNIVEAVQKARALGDLSENAEYQGAREKQKSIEGRINYLQEMKMLGEIFDPATIRDKSHVRFGANVKLACVETGNENIFKIVSEYESDPSNGLVSSEAFMAKMIIGKQINDIIQIKKDSNWQELEIIEIWY